MKLSTLLSRDNNNLDIFRVIAACMVIYGHAYALVPHSSKETDFIARLLKFDYSGSLAVNIFFFLSGLVVTNSLLSKRSPIDFIIARAFRIWPALIFTVVVTATIIGPIVTTLPIDQYFQDPATFKYVTNNITMSITHTLPGVFESNYFKSAVNGSLWTIPYEIAAYTALLAFFMLGASKSKWIAISIFLIIAVTPFLPEYLKLSFLPSSKLAVMLAPCFAAGAILALLKDHIHINLHVTSGLWILYFLINNSSIVPYLFYSALFVSILYLSSLAFTIKLKMKSDISYGIYLWGFPVQQILVASFPEQGLIFNQISAMIICCILGYASWMLIEKNCSKYGSTLAKKLHRLSIPRTATCTTQEL